MRLRPRRQHKVARDLFLGGGVEECSSGFWIRGRAARKIKCSSRGTEGVCMGLAQAFCVERGSEIRQSVVLDYWLVSRVAADSRKQSKWRIASESCGQYY